MARWADSGTGEQALASKDKFWWWKSCGASEDKRRLPDFLGTHWSCLERKSLQGPVGIETVRRSPALFSSGVMCGSWAPSRGATEMFGGLVAAADFPKDKTSAGGADWTVEGRTLPARQSRTGSWLNLRASAQYGQSEERTLVGKAGMTDNYNRARTVLHESHDHTEAQKALSKKIAGHHEFMCKSNGNNKQRERQQALERDDVTAREILHFIILTALVSLRLDNAMLQQSRNCLHDLVAVCTLNAVLQLFGAFRLSTDYFCK